MLLLLDCSPLLILTVYFFELVLHVRVEPPNVLLCHCLVFVFYADRLKLTAFLVTRLLGFLLLFACMLNNDCA